MAEILPEQAVDDENVSTFDFLEMFCQEFSILRQNLMGIVNLTQNHVHDAKERTEEEMKEILESNKKAVEQIDVPSKLENFENMIQKFVKIYSEEVMTFSAKYTQETTNLKEALFRSQQAEVSLRIHSDQETMKFHAQESSLKKRISELEREAETARLTLQQQLDNLSETIREEKETRKRMEQWFQRRLDTLDYYAQDVKLNPLDEKKIDHLISKINRLKVKKPWNKNNLILDDAVLNPKNEDKSSGTCTPFSHYACFFSSAASEENTINQAFIESQDRSLSENGDILLDTSESMISTDRPRKDAVDSFTKKMFDNKLSLTEKEKLFCAVLENNLAHEDLLHVNLEDILNVPNQEEEKGPDDQPSISLGSLKFDIKEEGAIGNGCRRFDNTIRFGDLKDAELENAVSSIHMEEDSQQKISNLLESKMLNSNWDQNIFSKASLSRIEMDKEKNSELDKPILSGFSISEIHHQESQRKTERGFLGLLEDNGANNISLSNISRKMEDNNVNDKGNKSNSSFLMDEDMRNLLNKATSELDLSTSSHNIGKDDGFKINISISELVKQLNTEFISDKILDKSFDNKSIHSHSHIRDPEVKQTELKVSKFAISDNKEGDQETEFILEEIHDNIEKEKKEQATEPEKTPTTTETDDKNKPQQLKKKINYPKPRPPAGPRKSMDFRLPANFLDEENTGGHMSFENTPQHATSKTSSPQLNYSMYNIAETSSFDVDISNQPQGQGNNTNYNLEVMKMKIEYKNKRTVRSQTPAVRPKLVLNTKFQNLTKNEHTEEDETPKRSDEPNASYHRSFSLQANQPYNYKTVQPHSSYISSQGMFFNGLGSSPGGPNDQEKFYRRMSTKDQAKLKNILPYEKSKQYPAPDKEQGPGPEFCRKVPAEKANSAKFASKIYYEMDGSPKKPISPLKKSRLSLEANNEGALQFRAKKFANKKGDLTPQ